MTLKLAAIFPSWQTVLKTILTLFVIVCATVFCTTAQSASAAEIEGLHGVQTTEKYCTIIVTSTGCTNKEDFISTLDKTTTVPTVTFIRLKPDPCRSASRPYPIKFSLSEIGATDFTLANPFTPSPSFY